MPLTWVAFLIGSVAIVGLPPLNGFVSEWVVFQAMLHGGMSAAPIRLALVGVAGLALIGGLALACFAKVCGIVFLGVPRSEQAAQGHEVEAGMWGPMFGLAAVCAVVGLVPVLAVSPALAAGASIARTSVASVASGFPAASTRIGLLSLAAVALLGIGSAAWSLLRRRRPIAEAATWGCGYALPSARMQYTASSFAAPLLAAYGPLAGVKETRDPGAYRSHARELVLEGAILPAWRALRTGLWRLRPMQRGRLWVYLLYLIAVLLLLLVYLAGASS
jgi:hydrogenase-4 component B